MEKIMAVLETVNGWVNNFVWGVPVLLLILGTGIFYTIRLGFLQFRHPAFLFKETVVKAFRKKDSPEHKPGEVTSFQAAMTSVGAIVGSGNIAGVSTALVLSSRINILGLHRSARAMQRRCFCPPDTLTPPCPSSVS